MTAKLTPESTPLAQPVPPAADWQPDLGPDPVWDMPLPPTDLIFDDGEPLESNRHRIAMNVLINSYQQHRQGDTDYYTGGNMFVYYSAEQVKNRDFRGPDFFVVLDVDGTKQRPGWVVWEESGRYPDVIVELLSDSTAEVDRTTKKRIYEQTFKTADYFIYDPNDATTLQGWHRHNAYEPLEPNERGWLWCETLGLWLGLWDGQIEVETTNWLRFYTPEGELVPLPAEAAQTEAEAAQAQAAQAQAEAAQAQAEAAQAQAEATQAQAEAAQAQAEAAQAQAEAAQAQAEAAQAKARSERLAERLRALGEDPDL
jgi:Uma2 family endonuclease